jgi:hypothetical protein
MQELLRNQHRRVLDSIRDGKVYELLGIAPSGNSPGIARKAAASPLAAPERDAPHGAVPISELFSQVMREKITAKVQDKAVADAAASNVNELSASEATVTAPVKPMATAADAISALSLEWLNANGSDAAHLHLQFRVLDGSAGLANARIFCRVDVPGFTSVYAQGNTDPAGSIELKFPIAAALAHQSSMLVQATHDNRMASKKFRIP